MNRKKRDKLSKFMSLILRHQPEKFGIVLNNGGYCSINDLLMVFHNDDFWSEANEDTINQIVKECPKQRYEMVDGMIRARYGHSSIKLTYSEKTPPKTLIHGTYEGAIKSIFQSGIKKMNREYVHLSETPHFASLAGNRRGELVLLEIDTEKAMDYGIKFYYAGNEVWLSDDVPIQFFKKKNEKL